MKQYRWYAAVIVITFSVIGARGVWAQYYKNQTQEAQDKKPSRDKKTETKAQAERVHNKICPVDFKRLYTTRKEEPEKLISYTHEGKTYDFDSQACVGIFKQDPEKYLEAWEKKERFIRINVIND